VHPPAASPPTTTSVCVPASASAAPHRPVGGLPVVALHRRTNGAVGLLQLLVANDM